MAWGNVAQPNISHPFTYEQLREEVRYKKSRNRGDVDKAYVNNTRTVYAHTDYDGDDILLRLHATDIVRYKPDGSMVLHAGGWCDSDMTRSWWWFATGTYLGWTRRTPWDGPRLMYGESLYYDDMVVGYSGKVLSEIKRPTFRKPTAEAYALRRKLTTFGKKFEPYIRMHEGSRAALPNCGFGDGIHIGPLLDDPTFVPTIELFSQLTQGEGTQANLTTHLSYLWKRHVETHKMFAEQY